MYTRYAEKRRLERPRRSTSVPAEKGGVKEMIFQVNGNDVFKKLRYESGVHRVQRVPATEAQGRVHTSTATVAVLPEANEVDVVIQALMNSKSAFADRAGPAGRGSIRPTPPYRSRTSPERPDRALPGRAFPDSRTRRRRWAFLRSRLLEKRHRGGRG